MGGLEKKYVAACSTLSMLACDHHLVIKVDYKSWMIKIMKSTPVKMRERCMFLRVRPQTGFRTGIRGVPDDQYDVDDDSELMISV